MKDPTFVKTRDDILDNLQAMTVQLDACIDSGLIDYGCDYYNTLSELQDDIGVAKTWNELEEIVTRAKTLEKDFDTFLSLKGKSTIGLSWPTFFNI